MCSKEHIVYRATCRLCEDIQIEEGATKHQVIHHQYIGESSRTLRVRSGQHQKDYHKCAQIYKQNPDRDQGLDQGSDHDKDSSFMWDHMRERHKNITVTRDSHFKFEVISSH